MGPVLSIWFQAKIHSANKVTILQYDHEQNNICLSSYKTLVPQENHTINTTKLLVYESIYIVC